MEAKPFFKKNILLLSLFLILSLYIWKSYPLSNNSVPLDSSDFSAHIFKIHYISQNSVTGWNSYWYGGFPFLKYYPPLSYLTASAFDFLGLYLSYNFFLDMILLLIPVSFFLFINQFALSKLQKSAALFVFSLSPAILVFYRNSNLPFLASFLFSIIFLIYFKNSLDGKTGILKPIVLLTPVLLTHVLMGLFLYFSAIIWFSSRYFTKSNLLKAIPILVIPAIAASFWYLPFSQGIYSGREGGVSILSDPLVYTASTTNQRLGTMGIPTELFIVFGSLLGLSLIMALFNCKEKTLKEFFPWLAISAILFLFLDYKRIIILMAIPIALLITLNTKRNPLLYLTAILIISNIILFSAFQINFAAAPTYPESGNRTLVLDEEKTCQGCSLFSTYLPAINGDEVITGWLPQSQNTNDLFEKRAPFLKKIQDPLSINQTEFNELAKAGMVNYIVVSKNSPEILNYFTNNEQFKLLREENGFIIYKADPEFSYIEINGQQIPSSVSKGREIEAEFGCSPGILTIKETYDKDWKITLNNQLLNPKINEYGFMEADISISGPCKLEMEYLEKII